MNDPLDTAAGALATVRALCGDGRADAVAPGDLVRLNEAFGILRRAVDAAYLPVAAEIARQSRAELGKDSLARKNGFRTPAAMISTVTGTSTAEALRAITIGESTAPRVALTGEQRPAKHPHVAEALRASLIGTLAAGAIVGLLDRVDVRADAADLDAMEQRLVEAAPGLPLDQLQKLLLRAEAHLDPDGVQPRDDERRSKRALSIHQDRHGMFVFSGRLDPETAAPVTCAIEGIVTGMMRRRDDAIAAGGVGQGEPSTADDRRSVAQMRADALADICRHAIGCTDVPTAPTTTVVVRMTLDQLESGVGAVTIDGSAAPVSAATARRMAADAQIIPCVLGGDSEILDWGRAKRLFTPAQKLAVGERDGGCSSCGLPPHLTVVHHIAWWKRDHGTTDLSNAILLCTTCHHRIHDDGWEIRIDGTGIAAKVWFIPPPWLDAAQSPRLGGRARFDLAA
ncbi:HNH endonuclease [Microbacterium sp. cx-55]|uniref:HNH endonuclease signature motif containing protein n=1 Tax=Microbacterium sp. cx-55 TaxID=2875948 RepID=UPI001CBC15B4|nr:HNH endonuclease signature motif containing protein [Microbacterium sp. cx-55]MBZ4487295.1 HNH endonuclease [Microbacterium sp. cx-55]UGB35317.1 HNH endonuclease [Microbacterium sp. cx-55]